MPLLSIVGLSMIESIFCGIAFVAGKNLVPRLTTEITAFLTFIFFLFYIILLLFYKDI